MYYVSVNIVSLYKMLKTFSWMNSPARTPDSTAAAEIPHTVSRIRVAYGRGSFHQPPAQVQAPWPSAGWVSRGKYPGMLC